MSEHLSKPWEIPDLTETPVDERRNALNMPLRWAYEPPEQDVAEEALDAQIGPLTAEALEAIREAARLEGYEEGKLEGIKAGHQEGFEAGYADGEALGKKAGEQQALADYEVQSKTLAQQWENLLAGLRHPLKQVDQAVENQLVYLSMALARAICWQEVQQNTGVVREAFKRGVQELGMSSQRVEIYIHPDDFLVIDQHWDEKTRADKGWFLYQDKSVGRGGCRIQTPLAAIDTTLESRMQEVFAQVQKGIKEIPADKPAVPETTAEPFDEQLLQETSSQLSELAEEQALEQVAQTDLNPNLTPTQNRATQDEERGNSDDLGRSD